MRKLFVCVLCGLTLLTAVAWTIQPKQVDTGRIKLLWTSDDNPVRRAQIDMFNKLNPQYNLRLDPANNGMEKVIVQSLAGVGPDLFDCYSAYQLSSYVKSGVAWDITDELKEMGIDINNDVWSVVLPTITYKGRVYGFPDNAGSSAVWFNKKIFDDHHIDYPRGPWTWDEMIKVAQKLTLRDKNGRITQYGLLFDWEWQDFVYQYGGSVYSKDGTRCTLDSPQVIASIELMRDLVYKYHIAPSPSEESSMANVGGWGSGNINQFGAGKGAMAVGGRYWLCSLRAFKDLKLGVVELPHGPKRAFYGYGRATLINKNSPRRQEALQFIKYMAGKDYNELVNEQADALSPVRKFTYTAEFLHNPKYPEEDYNAVWRDSMKYAVSDESSPFVSGQMAGKIISRQLDLVRSGVKTPEAAMKKASALINAEIQKNISEDPVLAKEYAELTRGRK